MSIRIAYHKFFHAVFLLRQVAADDIFCKTLFIEFINPPHAYVTNRSLWIFGRLEEIEVNFNSVPLNYQETLVLVSRLETQFLVEINRFIKVC